jgi:hypothetical protein
MRPLLSSALALAGLHLTAAAQSAAQPAPAPQSAPSAAPQAALPMASTPAPSPGGAQDGGAPVVLDVALDDAVPGAGDADSKSDASPYFLGFVASNYYPPADERVDPLLVSQVRLEPTDGRPAPTSFGFVMFRQRITAQRIAQLEELGCRVLGRHPFYTLKVAFDPQRLDDLAALDFVRWIGAPRHEQKVHPSLVRRIAATPAGELVDMYVSVYESDLGDASTSELTATPRQVGPDEPETDGDAAFAARAVRSNGWQQRALEALGCEVGVYDDAQRTFRVRAPGAALELLAPLDFVQFVEEVTLARSYHDDSTAMIMADSSRWYANGNTNFPVPVGELDTGISLTHWDLAFHLNGVGWDFSGSGVGPWADPCGHGTHVCGTIAGDGSASAAHRGVAPGVGSNGQWARFFNAKILMGCGTQTVDFAGALSVMRQPYTTSSRPMIVNNSWGASPVGSAWVGSEYEARLLDDEVFWQQQLYVFAAGNDGPSSGTIGLPGCAKNAFTVGSVNDFRSGSSYPGALSGFSSRGVTGDSRWKPNVVAPGDAVRSLLAGSSTGYTQKSGTSMATPHVAGLAAQMCDNHAFFRNAPARVAANLMATAMPKDNIVITTHSNGHLDTYGAGRAEAFHANFNSNGAGWTNWGFDLNAGQGANADVYVYPGCARLVIAMTWYEQAASAGASQAAINDWDLYIDYEPFAAGTNTGEYNAGLSSRNNTEIRYIENPPAGWYRWKAHPYSATSTGRFGVSAFAVYSDTTPNTSVSVSQTATYVQPGQAVTFTVSVSNPAFVSSATHVQVNPVGGSISSAYRYLGDGTFDDLSDNANWIYECQLGDILNANSRGAYFDAAWYTDGWKNFDTSVYADNVGFRTAQNWVLVDGTPPTQPANALSTSHSTTDWSCSNYVDLAWDASFDAGIGVAGYSWELDQAAFTDPDAAVDTSATNLTLYAPDSLAVYYFHLRSVDWMGNASATVHVGPFSVMSAGGWPYCSAKANSLLCVPYMSMTGRISLTGDDDLHLYGSQVLSNKTGLLFWGFGETSQPFQGGLKCVAQPSYRTPTLHSGGTVGANDCTGVFDFAFTRAYALANGWNAPGSVVFTQYWYRDPQDPFGTGLTDATAIVMCE